VILFDARWNGDTGIGRFCREVRSRIHSFTDLPLAGNPAGPFDPLRLSAFLLRQKKCAFFSPGYNSPIFGARDFIITVHDLNHIDVGDNSGFLKRLYYRVVLKRACKRASRVLTVSEFSRQRIISWAKVPGESVVCVGNGVSDVFLQGQKNDTSRDPSNGYLFCVGNRKGHKNEVAAVRALSDLRSYQKIRLVFSGPPSKELLDEAERLGVSSRVQFAGRLSEEELRAYYQQAAALVFLSLYEGFGLPMIEAMAVGCPVIASSTTALGEIAGEAAVLVNPTNQAETVAALQSVLESSELRRRLAEKGQVHAMEFGWDLVAGRVKREIQLAGLLIPNS